MKTLLSSICMSCLLLWAGSSWAIQSTFTITATLPTATSLVIGGKSFLYNADGTRPTDAAAYTDITSNALGFGNLVPNQYGLWGSSQGFVLTAANNGTTGSPQVQFTYADGNNPNGTTHGLGTKMVMGFERGGTSPAYLYTKTLADSNGFTVPSTALAGGWLSLYLAVYQPPASGAGVANAEPFSGTDVAGIYGGTLTITATIV